MLAPFDIFKTDDLGPIWRGSVHNLDEAKESVRTLAQSEPGDYLIVCQETGNRIHIRASGQLTDAHDD